jgi:hypothetical protein
VRGHAVVGCLLTVILAVRPVPHGVLAQDATGLQPDEVRLLDAGAEPRRLLRYAWVEGVSQSFIGTTTTHMTVTVDSELAVDVTMPVSQTMAMRVADIADDGIATIELTITGVTMDAVPAGGFAQNETEEAMVRSFELLEPFITMLNGATGRAEVDSVGRLLLYEIDYPEGFPAALETIFDQQLKLVAEPLPTEPVGVGATWQSGLSGSGVQAGIEVAVTSEVTTMEKTAVVLEKRIEGSFPVQSPGAGQGSMTGHGSSFVDLMSIQPDSHFEFAATVEARDDESTVVTTTTMSAVNERLK